MTFCEKKSKWEISVGEWAEFFVHVCVCVCVCVGVCVCAVEGNQRGHILFLLQQACWRSRYTLWSWSEIGDHSDCSNTSSNNSNNYNKSDNWDWSSELLAAEICSFNDHGKSCSCTHNCSHLSSSSCSCGSPGSCCSSSSSCCTITGSYSRTHLNSSSVQSSSTTSCTRHCTCKGTPSFSTLLTNYGHIQEQKFH